MKALTRLFAFVIATQVAALGTPPASAQGAPTGSAQGSSQVSPPGSAQPPAPAAVADFVGTWRAARDHIVFHLRVHADGRVDFVSPADGSMLTGRAMIGNLVGASGFTGLLPNGEIFSIGRVRGTPAVSVGTTVLALESLPPQRLGVEDSSPGIGAQGRVAAAPSGGTAAGAPAGAFGGASAGAASLAGLRLSMAKGGNGYFIERSYDLCADGRVYTRWAESQLSQMGSGVSERTDQGTWRQDGGTLRLQLARGGALSFAVVRPEAGVVRLDGTGYAAEASRRCR